MTTSPTAAARTRRLLPLVLLALLVLAALAGCSTVRTIAPLEGQPVPADARQLEGTWHGTDLIVRLAFDQEGQGQFAALLGLEVMKGRLHPVEGQGRNYVSLDFDYVFGDSVQWYGYDLYAYSFTADGDLQLEWPDAEAFAEAVKAGELAGEVTNENESTRDVVITAPPAELMRFLADRERRPLFQTDEMAVLKRLE